MRILLTGFNEFGGLEYNPSEVIVKELAERLKFSESYSLLVEVLPTEFYKAGMRIRELMETFKPDVVIGLGVAVDRHFIQLERIALNLMDTVVPDNAGAIYAGTQIVPDGPLAYLATLPLDKMRARIQSLGLPVEISNHAGTYVCNNVFYLARHETERLGLNIRCGFIHIPPFASENRTTNHHRLGLSPHQIIKAIEACIDVLQETTASENRLRRNQSN
ncbi:MAG TPA: pyroglutamyl-peptidase I [Pyrinomonadaceae bacterium]|nr:pyroglutamyl-peptidase I [Pyrinomonadaceae bacterium]